MVTVQDATQTNTSSSAGSDPRLSKFKIPQAVKEKYPELIPLILDTQSMNDQERTYWFQILPIMSVEQVDRLKNILITEKDELNKLDKEYEEEISRINIHKADASKKFQESEEKRQEIKKQEEKDEQKEAKNEEDILAQLSSI